MKSIKYSTIITSNIISIYVVPMMMFMALISMMMHLIVPNYVILPSKMMISLMFVPSVTMPMDAGGCVVLVVIP